VNDNISEVMQSQFPFKPLQPFIPHISSTCGFKHMHILKEKINNVPILTITSGFATSLTFENKFQMNSMMAKRTIDSECQYQNNKKGDKKKNYKIKKRKMKIVGLMHSCIIFSVNFL